VVSVYPPFQRFFLLSLFISFWHPTFDTHKPYFSIFWFGGGRKAWGQEKLESKRDLVSLFDGPASRGIPLPSFFPTLFPFSPFYNYVVQQLSWFGSKDIALATIWVT